MSALAGLEPKEVFHYFEEISNIPCPSYKEEKISNYLVEFVASDGRTWKDSWGSFKIGGETLKVNALKAVRDSKNILTCTASITNQSAIQAAYFHVYNGTKLLGSWKWEYGTSYLTHAFNLGSKAATHVQYVVYDGNEWKDKWTEIK